MFTSVLNSAIVAGMYFGFLTTFSVGPSYIFLIRARVMHKGTETEIAATTGFITGQLMMFISIYYAPFHLALSRPHTITALTLPYLYFNFIYKNDKQYYSADYYYYGYDKLHSGYKNPNSIRQFHICKVFLNNLFFQLSNPFLFPSSILLRLMNIYLFRSNNPLVFLTSSFIGWLIGHIFLMKSIGLILLVWSKQKNAIKSHLTMRFDKYILLQLRNYMGEIFVLFSVVLLGHYLGRTPLPYFFTDEILELEYQKEEINVEIDSETEETKEEQNGSIEDEDEANLFSYLFPKKDKTLDDINIEEENNIFALDKPLVTTLFDYRRWNRPLRYIKNDHFERVVRDENSQFFFHIGESDGKERISFTYPPDLSSFLKIMENKMDTFTRDKISYNENELFHDWSCTNKEKINKLSNEFFKRAKVIDKKYKKLSPVDVLENRGRLLSIPWDIVKRRLKLLYADRSKTKHLYLNKIYDPVLNGPFRGQSFLNSPSIENEPDTRTRNQLFINKIHALILPITSNDPEFKDERDRDPMDSKILNLDDKSIFNEIVFFINLMSRFSTKRIKLCGLNRTFLDSPQETIDIYCEEKERYKKFLLEAIRTDRNTQTFLNRKEWSGINEISKEVPRWSYKLIDEVEQLTERLVKEPQIRNHRGERINIFDGSRDSMDFNLGPRNDNDNLSEEEQYHEYYLLNFSRQADYDRDLIKGSMRALRRKTATTKIYQADGNVHSPTFLEVIDHNPLGDLFDDLSQYWKQMFGKPGTDNSQFMEFQKRMVHKYEEEDKDDDEIRLKKIEEDWESILYGLIIRSFVLLTQSFIRKYIILPSLIISKNIIRIVLLQDHEFAEDLRDWRREVHIKCTYQGIPVSDKELPTNWFHEGIQIRILCPFVLKPWHKSKVQSIEKKKKDPQKYIYKKKDTENKNLWFLTGYGTLVESYLDEGLPTNPLSFLAPILRTISKKLRKDFKKRFFRVLKVLNERKKEFRTMLKKIENWNMKIKRILFMFKILDETLDETMDETIDELSESKKTSTMSKNNSKIEESPVQMESISSFTEKRIKDVNVKTKTMIKEIETMTEEKKEGILTSEINLNSNKTTYDAKRLELQKNILQILQRIFVRLIRKSYSFFKIFIEGVYTDSLLCIRSLARIHRQRFRESIDKILNVIKSIYYKKMEERRENQSLLSIIEKFDNMNSDNSSDVSSLSQPYVCFKLAKSYNIKLRATLKSCRRSVVFKNEIKDDFGDDFGDDFDIIQGILGIQGIRGIDSIKDTKVKGFKLRGKTVVHKTLKRIIYNKLNKIKYNELSCIPWVECLNRHPEYFPRKKWWGLASKDWRNKVLDVIEQRYREENYNSLKNEIYKEGNKYPFLRKEFADDVEKYNINFEDDEDENNEEEQAEQDLQIEREQEPPDIEEVWWKRQYRARRRENIELDHELDCLLEIRKDTKKKIKKMKKKRKIKMKKREEEAFLRKEEAYRREKEAEFLEEEEKLLETLRKEQAEFAIQDEEAFSESLFNKKMRKQQQELEIAKNGGWVENNKKRREEREFLEIKKRRRQAKRDLLERERIERDIKIREQLQKMEFDFGSEQVLLEQRLQIEREEEADFREEEADFFENEMKKRYADLLEMKNKKKKRYADLLEMKNKMKKQYRYDLFCYEYLHFVDKKKSYIDGYGSPQGNKNEGISYNYKISLENYIEEDDILDMEKNLDRKYFIWTGLNVKRNNNSKFWFFSNLSDFYSAYKRNPWILPIKFFVLPLYGNWFDYKDSDKIEVKTEEYVSPVDDVDVKSRSYYPNGSDYKYRTDLMGERDFLLSKYLGFYLDCDSYDEEKGMDNTKFFCLLLRMKNVKKSVIMAIKKRELDIEMLVDSMTKDFCYTECRDIKDLKASLMFFIEPIRVSRKNQEQFLLYQTLRLPLIHNHKSKRIKRWPFWKTNRVHKKRRHQKRRQKKYESLSDLFVPENLFSTRRRRELRILTCLNSMDRNTVHKKRKNVSQAKKKHLDSETKKLMNLKSFLWPNYRLEDLACINRYWFNTHTGSNFSILRIRLYPRLKD
uniref:Hypothetical chloroplast RF1 n=1 Tax=Medicago arabica TaxID=70936 RepID=A0A898ND23_9FABA|nr:hypothetical chloroplast RF1 [Medicago arabica]QSJ48862.1 hypothetical chloroplast RF1 [Medicago arabica]UGK73028.1 hypothetical protein RF1 [Medicago arabica]UZC30303.1 hypothetical protein RF1 [Medicago arabica]UZC30379.1 hypothetical protein RF1 [Medicago arabica]